MEVFEKTYNILLSTSIWEWMAVLSGIIYVILISFKKIAAWFFAIVSSALYIYLCYISRLYLDTGLQTFFLVMGLYGWYEWTEDSKDNIEPIVRWPLKYHIINILGSTVLMLLLGYLFDTFTDQMNPYADAFASVFSLAATFMVTRKVLENWVYWITVNLVNIYLFSSRELNLTGAVYAIYAIIAVFGLINWIRLYKAQT